MQPSSLSPISFFYIISKQLVWLKQSITLQLFPLLWSTIELKCEIHLPPSWLYKTMIWKWLEIVALSVLAITWWERHIRAGSKYQAVQEGTSGCSRCLNARHYKRKGGRLFSAGRVLLCQASKRDSLSYSAHCSPLQQLEVRLPDRLTQLEVSLLLYSSVLADSTPCPWFNKTTINDNHIC